MDKLEISEDKISKNFIFFDFRDFSFHNYGQMFPKWHEDKSLAKEDDTSLNCSPDTDAAIQDALEEIIRDLSSEKIEEHDIKLLSDNGSNNFNKFTTWLNNKKIEEYEKYIKKNIKNFASKKHKESDKLCKKVFESLFTPANFHKFHENITNSITDFLKKEEITDDNTNKKKYLFKYLNVLLRTIPQPWNALAGGAILKCLINPELEDKNIERKDSAFLIHDISISDGNNGRPDEYTDTVKHIQFYLEYALVINTPDKWEPPGTGKNASLQISMIAFPLIDNGFFRGYYYLLSSNTQRIKDIWEKNLKQYGEKCLFFTDSLRSAHETEMMNILFREKGVNEGEEEREKDIYRRILKNLHYIQEVSLGSLWMVNGNSLTQSYVTGYGRDFKEQVKSDGSQGIYWYKGYGDYKAFFDAENINDSEDIKIGKEEGSVADKVKKYFCNDAGSKETFYRDYPKFDCFLKNNFNSECIPKGSYYKQSSLDIKWRLTLPVVRGDELKAIYFLYYRDPIVMHADKFTLLTKVKDVNMQKSLRKEIFGLRARQIMKFFSAIEAYEERKFEIIKHGTKAATNAIISRNFSHHIGSHVVPRATVEKIQKQVEAFHSDIQKTDEQKNDKLLKIINTLKTRLDTYNQKKADFMAEIATEPLATTKSMYFYKDIIVPFITNTLLIGNICENEGLGYNTPSECRVKIRFFFGKDNNELIAKFSPNTDANNYPYISCELNGDRCCSLDNPEEIRKQNASHVNDDGDKEIAVPGPLGEFAFYSFLENFIRNAAKHNIKKWEYTKNLEVNIKISEIMDVAPNDPFYKEGDQNEFYNVEIWDNVTAPNKQGFKVKENGAEVEKNLCEFINHQVRQPIVNDDGSLRKGSWGIAEMKIMATLLRGSDCFEKMEENLRSKVVQDRLIYEFKVMKPKKIAVISQETTKTNKYGGLEFKNKGIWLFNGINDFFERLKNGRSRASFEFALLDKDIFEELKNYKNVHNSKYKRLLAILPFRVIVEGYNDLMEEICKIIPGASGIKGTLFNNSTTPQDLINSIWQEWINYLKKRIINGADLCVLLFLQQNKNENPTSYYIKKAECMENFHVIAKGTDGLQCNHNNSNLLLFDRHFHAYAEVENECRIKDLRFHEAIDKNNPDFVHMFSPPFVDKKISEEFIHALIEAGLLRILIIDERIAEKAYDNINWIEKEDPERAYHGTQRIYAARGGGIYICTHLSVFDGDEKPVHPNIEDSPSVSVRVKLNMKSKEDLDYSKEPTVIMVSNQKKEILKLDAIIIHQGILENEELVGISENKFGDFLEKIKEKYPYLVVDSGRGIPHKLHKLAKFMPFSLLDDCVGRERIAKYNIVKILMSLSRRTNDV